MSIRIYTEKVKVPGSLFQEYALLSKLSGKYIIKHLRFIDPVVDDDGNIFPFVRKDHIIFIDGLAVSVKSLADFLANVIDDAYTDYPASLRLKKPEGDPLEHLANSLERLHVVTITRFHSTLINVLPKDEKKGSPWNKFYDLMVNVGYTEDEIDFENEVTDFD